MQLQTLWAKLSPGEDDTLQGELFCLFCGAALLVNQAPKLHQASVHCHYRLSVSITTTAISFCCCVPHTPLSCYAMLHHHLCNALPKDCLL